MSAKKKENVEKQAITLQMISDYEAKNRQAFLFCGSFGTGEVEGYAPSDIPKGFYSNAHRFFYNSRSNLPYL